VTVTSDSTAVGRVGPIGRVSNAVCRRAFSSPEALAYELTIAQALAEVVMPAIKPYIVGPRVLDVGCGGGRVAASIAAALPVSVVGVDPSASQIHRLARHTRQVPEVAGVLARGETLPFKNYFFDSVISSCAWKHWPNPTIGVAECLRVLRPGGSLVIVEIDGSSTADEFWLFARNTRVPLGMRRAYLRFAMRTVVGVAPGRDALERSFLQAGALMPDIRRIEGMPFWLATAEAKVLNSLGSKPASPGS
jgi:SAM-dependent methyltransferase